MSIFAKTFFEKCQLLFQGHQDMGTWILFACLLGAAFAMPVSKTPLQMSISNFTSLEIKICPTVGQLAGLRQYEIRCPQMSLHLRNTWKSLLEKVLSEASTQASL